MSCNYNEMIIFLHKAADRMNKCGDVRREYALRGAAKLIGHFLTANISDGTELHQVRGMIEEMLRIQEEEQING